MILQVNRDIEAIAFRVSQTLGVASRYDLHPYSRHRNVDILGTRWFIYELFKMGIRREEIIDIFNYVGGLGKDGKRFLDDVVDAAERETSETLALRLGPPIQLSLPYDYRRIKEIICAHYS